jgi:hypothetical protein
LFNETYCFNTFTGGGALFNCDGSVTYYDNTECTPAPSFKPTSAPLNTPSVAPSVAGTAAPTDASQLLDKCQVTGNQTVYYTCYTSPVSSPSKKNKCFAGSETVLLQSGNRKPLSEVVIGDMVMIASETSSGIKYDYSPVIALPHGQNRERVDFLQITTSNSRDVKLTPEHLIFSGRCIDKMSLKQADTLEIGMCVQTVSAVEIVVSIERVSGDGIYTLITLDGGLIVVNDIVASPFAVNHQVVDSFYNIHRVIYRLIPAIARVPMYTETLKIFGDLAVTVFA